MLRTMHKKEIATVHALGAANRGIRSSFAQWKMIDNRGEHGRRYNQRIDLCSFHQCPRLGRHHGSERRVSILKNAFDRSRSN